MILIDVRCRGSSSGPAASTVATDTGSRRRPTLVGLFVIGVIDNSWARSSSARRRGARTHHLLLVLGGLQVFGILGLVLGPVIVAITLALLDVFRKADDHPPHATTDEKSLLEEQEALREVPSVPETA